MASKLKIEALSRRTNFAPATQTNRLLASGVIRMRIMMRLIAIGLIAFVVGAAAPRAQLSSSGEIAFGLVPALSPERFTSRLQPLAIYLAERLGVPVRLVGAPSYTEFIARIVDGGHYDIIFTGSDIYRYAERNAGYRAVARVKGEGVFAVIAARIDADIQSLSDLPIGTRIAITDPLALSTRLCLKKLRDLGVDAGQGVEIVETPTQNASMLSMFNGLTDVAIFMNPVLNRASPEVRSRIQVLARTDLAPHHPISVAPTIPDDLAELLRTALVELNTNENGAAILKSAGYPGFIAADPSDYDAVEWTVEDIQRQLSSINNK